MKALVVALAACKLHAPPPALSPAAAGLSIALYRGDDLAYGVVDDRRWVDVAGKELALDHVDPGATLASLVIEPLETRALHVGECTRDRIPEPEVKPTDKLADPKLETKLDPKLVRPERFDTTVPRAPIPVLPTKRACGTRGTWIS